MIMPIILSRNPVLTMVRMLSLLLPNTMAFGGVAVGSIKASEEAMVAGIMKSMGLLPLLTASPAKSGRSAVMARGMASVIHQTAISTATAKVAVILIG